jgi:hypothetical protein
MNSPCFGLDFMIAKIFFLTKEIRVICMKNLRYKKNIRDHAAMLVGSVSSGGRGACIGIMSISLSSVTGCGTREHAFSRGHGLGSRTSPYGIVGNRGRPIGVREKSPLVQTKGSEVISRRVF